MIDFDNLLVQSDPDRRQAALFAAPEARGRLYALYAFYHEIAKVPDSVTEPVIGEMKLAWARDAVSDLFETPAKVRRHDVYEGVSQLLQAPGAPAKADLITLVEARMADLGEGGFPSAQDRQDYVDRTAGVLMRLAAQICLQDDKLNDDTKTALIQAGRLWGYVGLMRAFPQLAAAGRAPLSVEEMAKADLSEGALKKGLSPEKAQAALTGLWQAIETARQKLTQSRGALPAELFPAVGYVALTSSYSRALKACDTPYTLQADQALLLKQMTLTWASLTGRI